MSHMAKAKVQFTNSAAIAAAVSQISGAKLLGQRTVEFFDGQCATGLEIRLPGWAYSIVVQPNGDIQSDNYQGRWGDPATLDRLCAAYAVAAIYQEAQLRGQAVEESIDQETGETVLKVYA